MQQAPLNAEQAVLLGRGLALAAVSVHRRGQTLPPLCVTSVLLRFQQPESRRFDVHLDDGGRANPAVAPAVFATLDATTVRADLRRIAAFLYGILVSENQQGAQVRDPVHAEQRLRNARPDLPALFAGTISVEAFAGDEQGPGTAQELFAALAELQATHTLDPPVTQRLPATAAVSAPGKVIGADEAPTHSQTGGSACEPNEEASESLTEQARIDREEHTANVMRLRNATGFGTVVYPLFFFTDWLMATYVHPTELRNYLLTRGLAWMVIVATAIWTRRPRLPPPSALPVIDVLMFGSATIGISFMCLFSGGLSSPYAAGIPVVLFCRGVFVTIPWRSAVWPVAVSTLSYPIILVVGTLLQDGGVQFRDPSALSIFCFYCGLIFTCFALTVVGGHTVWALRRQVFAARNLGRYRLVRCIGQGGMGEVWVAHHAALKRDVALKILRADRVQSDVARQRFEREVRATTELSHPNTIRIFDYGVTDDGLWYYAMELLKGEDLGSLVKREGPLAESRCVQIMLQVCGALAEAHGRGIVHRDVKPENIFLCALGGVSDFAKVLDFGIAKREHAEDRTLTQARHLIGTPAYASPEAAFGRAVDARSDVYGLGALMYFLLTAQAPFEELGAAGTLVAHALHAPKPPGERRGRPVNPDLERLILRCLAKEPNARFLNAGAVAQELALILASL